MVGGSEKTKLMLCLTLVEIEVEVGVELGKNDQINVGQDRLKFSFTRMLWILFI